MYYINKIKDPYYYYLGVTIIKKTMSLLCKLVDHKYSNVTTREEIEERNGQKISVKIRTKKCARCGYTKEDRIRTIVESEDRKNVSDNEEDNTQEDTNPTKSNTFDDNNSIVQQNKALNENMESSEEDDSIILKENNESNDKQKTVKKQIKISCSDCEYTDTDTEKHRRSGDFCPECGGWLEVDN